MSSIKLKFRPSDVWGHQGVLVYQVVCCRAVYRIRSEYRIGCDEWNATDGQICFSAAQGNRGKELFAVSLNVQWDMYRLQHILSELEQMNPRMKISDVLVRFKPEVVQEDSVFAYFKEQIVYKRQSGRIRSSETYQSTLNSFAGFRCGVDLSFSMIDSRLMQLYEAYLHHCSLSRNTTSFYMRILRTVYRQAVEQGITADCHPFQHVYCGMDKTVKRSISFGDIKKIKELDLSDRPMHDWARDMFIFSFCTRGMSFVDMAFLKKQDLKDGYIYYRRRKTGQQLVVEWTEQMQAILNKYKSNPTDYLLPIITRSDGTERRQYLNCSLIINRKLKEIANFIGIPVSLSLYYSRHSWASIARNKGIPLCVISEGLGHSSEQTTQIYLDSISLHEVDKANRQILNEFENE